LISITRINRREKTALNKAIYILTSLYRARVEYGRERVKERAGLDVRLEEKSPTRGVDQERKK
jgi:hypothetical protein